MKKYLMTVVAALAAASFTSCSNEMDMFDPISSDKATIDLNVSNDIQMATRSSEIDNYSEWFVKVTPKIVESTAAGKTTTAQTWFAANLIGSKSFLPGGYSIEVSNYEDEADAYPSTNANGYPYYVGSLDKVLLRGPNSVVIDCGQAKNCRVKADLSALSSVTTIVPSSPNVTLTQEGRGVTSTNTAGVNCPALYDGEIGYFMAGTDITYQLNYSYKSDPTSNDAAILKHSATVTIKSPAEHTEYQIVATSNSNGTITLKIMLNGDFEPSVQPSITIDAASGNQVTNP